MDSFSIFVPFGLVIGNVFGVLMIPKYMSQTMALKVFACIGIVSALLLIFLSGESGVYIMALIGFASSLMWPAIWPLAIADLGKITKAGASLLVMGIVGGAVIPLIFGFIVNLVQIMEVTTVANYKSAFWIFIPSYLYILFFAIKGYKIRK